MAMTSLRRMHTNLGGINTAFSPFLNWAKVSSSWTLNRTAGGALSGAAIWSAGGYLNTATGELSNPLPSDVTSFSFLFFTQPIDPVMVTAGCKYDGETWVARWQGSATGNIDFLTTGGTQDKSVAGQISFTMGTAPGNTQLTLTPTNTNDPPHSIFIYQTRYAANVANGEMFNPDWLAQVGKFRTLRVMDWMGTNQMLDSQTDSSQFPTEAYTGWGNFNGGPLNGMPLSVLAKLANATGCRIHFNFPHAASDQCITDVATFFKANTNLVVEYELSNEMWNFSFHQFGYFLYQGCRNFGKKIANIVASTSPTSITITGHGFTTGQPTGFLVNDPNFSALNQTTVNCTVIDANTITIPVSTSGFGSFTNTDSWASQDQSRYPKQSGYRSAQMMNIIRGVYNDATRWEGVLPSFTTGAAVSTNLLVGIAKWKSDTSSSLNVSDLFKAIYITGYFGDAQPTGTPVSIGVGTTPIINEVAHGRHVGDILRFFAATGMTQINNLNATITSVTDADHYVIDRNTTGFSAWVNTTNNYIVRSLLWDMMDTSLTNHTNDPVTYPTKYTWFAQQVATSFLTGTCTAGFATSGSVVNLQTVQWPAHMTIAQANGLELRQYENGSQFVGGGDIAGNGGNAQFTDYMLNTGWGTEIAAVYAAGLSAFYKLGGKYPDQFTIDGGGSRFGTWGALRFWKTNGNGNTDDTGNPKYQAILNFNNNKIPETYAVRLGS